MYPSIGNHDAAESEDTDDRGQVEDNFYLAERVAGEEAAGRASFGPGLFYRFRFGSEIEFVCIDTSKETFLVGRRLFEYPKHRTFVDASFPSDSVERIWRIPFAHHPPFSAGPRHRNTRTMARLLPLLQRAGVKVMFSGHEHNFQHSSVDGIDYFVTGAAGHRRTGTPDRFEAAGTLSWSADCHFLLVRIVGDRLSVRAIGERPAQGSTALVDIVRLDREGKPVESPMEVRR